MIFKSEKRFYDLKESRYTVPVCSFDSDLIQIVMTDEKTGKQKRYDFYSVYVRYHVHYVMEHHPERFEKLVNECKIYDYLIDIEEKAKDAVDRQVERWKKKDHDYQLAVRNGDFLEQVKLTNSLEAAAKEIVFNTIIYV